MDWEAIAPKLKAQLNPKHVKKPPQGKYGEYIEGWHAIAEANEVFGHGGWSYRIEALDEAMRELVWLEARGEKYQQWRVCHVCRVVVTVGDVSRHDIGTGQGQAKLNSLGDAIDSSAKESVTDALKRALRSFGWRFGLALYDKTKEHVGVDPDPDEAQKPVRRTESTRAAQTNAASTKPPAATATQETPQPGSQKSAAINWLWASANADELRARMNKLGRDKPEIATDPDVEDTFDKRLDALTANPFGAHHAEDVA